MSNPTEGTPSLRATKQGNKYGQKFGLWIKPAIKRSYKWVHE